MRFSQLKSLQERIDELTKVVNNDNLHRIAISNLSDPERQLARWWTKKYKQPLRSYQEHTLEELMLERLEDYYEANPTEIERFAASQFVDEEWDGTMPEEHEREVLARIAKIDARNRVDIAKYQGPDVSDEEAEKILASLGLNLPKSSKKITSQKQGPTLGEDEFDELY